ncbi:MAG: esterase family protein [Chloroflexi bacterium]|nr:esterase family protein [Chloroflexota bacterium]
MLAAALPLPTLTLTPTPVPTIPPSYTPPPTATPTLIPTLTATPSATPHWTSTCNTPGQIVTGVFPDPIAGPERSYRVYLPPCYGQDGHIYPVLYIFHGTFQDDSTWDRHGLDEAAEAMILAQEIPPLVMVMPTSADIDYYSSGGANSWEGVVMNHLLPFVESNYCVAQEAPWRAIGGLSRGAYWSLEIAFQHPAMFGNVGAHGAALEDTAAGPAINPQYSWQGKDLSGMRLYLDTGDADWYRRNFEQLHTDLAAANIPHEWHLNEGTHEDAYWAGHVRDYLLWYTELWPQERASYPLCQVNGG